MADWLKGWLLLLAYARGHLAGFRLPLRSLDDNHYRDRDLREAWTEGFYDIRRRIAADPPAGT